MFVKVKKCKYIVGQYHPVLGAVVLSTFDLGQDRIHMWTT